MEMKDGNITEVHSASYVVSVAVLRGTCRGESCGGRYKSDLCARYSLSHVGISGEYCVERTGCVCSRECCSSCLKREDFTHQESRQERDHCNH